MGRRNQPDYVNFRYVVSQQALVADGFLHCLQNIENDQGRVRKGERWGREHWIWMSLIYGDQEIDLPDLIVPHKGGTGFGGEKDEDDDLR